MGFEKKLDEALDPIRPKPYYEIRDKSTNSVYWVMSTDQPVAVATTQTQSIGALASNFVVNEISMAEFEQLKAGGILDITQEKQTKTQPIRKSSVGAPKIVEFIFGARGVGMWLDSEAPDNEFDIEGEYETPRWLTPKLSFDGVPVSSVEFDVDPDNMFSFSFTVAQRGDDAGMEHGARTINTNKGKEPKPPTVVKMKIGDTEVIGKAVRTIVANADQQKRVRLLNGELANLENQYYVQFQIG
jgi:hypothetical protein